MITSFIHVDELPESAPSREEYPYKFNKIIVMALAKTTRVIVFFLLSSQLIPHFHHSAVCHGYLGPSFMLFGAKFRSFPPPLFDILEEKQMDFDENNLSNTKQV